MIHREGPNRPHWVAGCTAITALCTATSASAQSATGASPTEVSGVELAVTITSADWITKPSSDKMNNYLPMSVTAKPGHRAGEVVLRCKLHSDTTVSDCTVVDQTNPKVPFGEAAVRASYLFRIRPRAANGTATDANWVLIPVSYDVTVIVN